jgi:hypothetical protein
MITECHTLLCVFNQLPTLDTQDYFVSGVLMLYAILMALFLYLTWKDKL